MPGSRMSRTIAAYVRSRARHSPSSAVVHDVDVEALGRQPAGDGLGQPTSSSTTSTRIRLIVPLADAGRRIAS